jgi:hypothetical protein
MIKSTISVFHFAHKRPCPLAKIWEGFCRKVLDAEGSTRPAAMIRIGLVFLIWGRWAGELLPFRPLSLYQTDMTLIGISFYLSTFLMLLGIGSRLTTFWTGATLLTLYYYAGIMRGVEPYTHHHTYLLGFATFLLAFTPCGGSYSWDRYLAVQKAWRENRPMPPEEGPLWAMRLLALQVSVIYLASAYNKFHPGFASGERLEAIFMYWYAGSDFPAIPGFHTAMMVLAMATVLLELGLAIGLWFSQTRPAAVVMGIGFHLLLYYTLPVATFSLTMILLYLCFFPPERIHRLMDLLQGIVTEKREKI